MIWVSVLKTLAFAGGAVLLFAVQARAVSVEAIYQAMDDVEDVYAGVTFPPPDVLLSRYDLESYRQDMERRSCRGAVLELVGAFGNKNPHLPHPISKGLRAWEYLYGPLNYPGPHFCRAQVEFADAYGALKEGDEPARLFAQLEKNAAPFRGPSDPIWRIQTRVSEFVRLALNGYPPAILELAKLSQTGEVVRLTPRFAYYALLRAKRSGFRDPDLDRLLNDAKRGLPDLEVDHLEDRAIAGTWPRSEPVVLD